MVILKYTLCVCRSASSCHIPVRFLRSGYRLKPDLNPEKVTPNQTDEEKYQEKVYQAMLHKQRSPLKGFNRVFVPAYRQSKDYKPLPNEKFYGRDDLPTYGCYNNYVKEAERARRKLRTQEIFWKTADFWGRRRNDEPDYVDIGLPLPRQRKSKKEVKALKEELKSIKTCPERERAARNRTLKVDVDSILEDLEGSSKGVSDIHSIAMHYGIYRDLFDDCHFYPVVRMMLGYEADGDDVCPVYYGNELSPAETAIPPIVDIESTDDDLWTLLLTSPDGNIEDRDSEYNHWLVGNIKGSDVSSGETLLDYLQPIPLRGIGYVRMVFLLFKQKQIIDFSEEKRELPCLSLQHRSFKTKLFAERFKDQLTPVSLRFFQTKWDSTVQETFHQRLNMAEPVYEFCLTPERKAPLSDYPRKKTIDHLKSYMPKEPIYPGGGAFS